MTGKWKFVILVLLLGNLSVAYVGYKAWEYREYINFWLDKYLYVVDEFSERDEYAEANKALRSDSIVDNRIVFFGSQVTLHWPLQRNFPEYEVINRGVDGQRAAGFLLRFRPDVIELAPEAVVIEVSSYNFRPNTSPREMLDYVTSMAELARYHGIEPVLTTVIPPRAGYEVDEYPGYSVRDTAALYSRWLTEYATRNKMLLADWRSAVSDDDGNLRPDLSISIVDLNDRGYDVISETVRTVLGSIGQQ